MLWGWTWQSPLQRVGVFIPVVVFSDLLAKQQRVGDHAKKQQERGKGQKRAIARDFVPIGKGLWIVDVAARHALATQEVLWEEGQVGADEHRPEVQLACPFRILTARHLAEVEVDTCKDAEHGAQRHHVVEVSHHIVGVMIGTVDGRLAQHDAGHAANGEEEEEAEGPEHRGFELDRAAPHGGDPREDLGWLTMVCNTIPPDILAADPKGFYDEYRAFSGLSKEIINPETSAYFLIISSIRTHRGMMKSSDALAKDSNQAQSVLAAYYLSITSYQHTMWMNAVKIVEEMKRSR